MGGVLYADGFSFEIKITVPHPWDFKEADPQLDCPLGSACDR